MTRIPFKVNAITAHLYLSLKITFDSPEDQTSKDLDECLKTLTHLYTF